MGGGIQKEPQGLDLFGRDGASGPFNTVRYLVLVHVILPVFYLAIMVDIGRMGLMRRNSLALISRARDCFLNLGDGLVSKVAIEFGHNRNRP